MADRAWFLKHLRRALNHLYDPEYLRRSPLVSLFGLGGRADAALALQRVLTEAVEALKPTARTPAKPAAWDVYEPLFYRYVERLSPQAVADQLAVGLRHYRRRQRAALDLLADLLWDQYGVEKRLATVFEADEPPESPHEVGSAVSEELAWLRSASERRADLELLLPGVLDLARRLAAQRGVHLEAKWPDALPSLAVHPVAVRQILLSVLSAALARATGGRLSIGVRPGQWDLAFDVRCDMQLSQPEAASEDQAGALRAAAQIADLCGCDLRVCTGPGRFEALVTFPALEQVPVLVIDDNPDTLQLLQRYAAGTRYRLITTRDPEQAFVLAYQCSPRAIVLDVMMPQLDGWQLLEQLRQHPATAEIPIIVCTILDQEMVAMLLGASVFVHKPLTRQEFLAALDQQVEPTARTPR